MPPPLASQARSKGKHPQSSSISFQIQARVNFYIKHTNTTKSVHDTNSNKDTGKVSHATGDSKVPIALQEALPEKVEKAVPNTIHDTSGLK